MADIVVVDGGSVDGTLEAVGAMPDLRVINGPDRGLYDAINKGTAAAAGDVIGILNSDDVYPPGTLAAVGAAFSRHAQAVCGTSLLVRDEDVVGVFDD